jgi:hypothetical protein
MAQLRGSVNEFKVDLLQTPPFSYISKDLQRVSIYFLVPTTQSFTMTKSLVTSP